MMRFYLRRLFDILVIMHCVESLNIQNPEVFPEEINKQFQAELDLAGLLQTEPDPDEVGSITRRNTETQNCPSCGRASTCCRIGDSFGCCKKNFSASNQNVEIDEENNVATYFYNNGVIRVMDFKKGLVSTYEPNDEACYVAAGLDYTLDDVLDAAEGKNTRNNKASEEHYYEHMNAKPLQDSSQLPVALKEKCSGRSIYWDERIKKEKAALIQSREMSNIGLARERRSTCMCCCSHCCNNSPSGNTGWNAAVEITSNAAKSMYASCKTGSRLLSCGLGNNYYRVATTSRLRYSYPDSSTTHSCKCSETYAATCYATCTNRALDRIIVSSNLKVNNQWTMATCPAGKKVLGCHAAEFYNLPFGFYPIADGSACYCMDSSSVQNGKCIATCASGVRNYEIKSTHFVGSASVSCSNPNLILGCGIYSTQAADISRSVFTSSTSSCSCTDKDRATCYAICGQL